MNRILAVWAFILVTMSVAGAQRLPEVATPVNYQLTFTPNLDKATFAGDETIAIQVLKPTTEITLNAVDLDLHEVTISGGGSARRASIKPAKEDGMVVLAVETPLSPGPATVHITYSGILNSEMRGFYLGKDDHGRRYAATQFEATEARRAYPSFDEPSYKATFDITAIVDKGMVAISNYKQISDTPGPGDKHTVKFATTAKMSSYLAALVVGNFEDVEGSVDGIPIRVYSTPGKKEMGKFALDAAEQIVGYMDKYFAMKYPYGKLDLVALPDFSAGAMENVGCVTFREIYLLVDEQHGSLDQKKNIASVTSHEIAHMWFGDLVTMQWWDDVWLNEGFATWMSSKPLEKWKPEWNFDLDDVSDTGNTLNLDSLANTRPVHQAAETPSQIEELFDGIAYGKAASVLRMVEAYLGKETFRAGVNTYLKQHQYANATAEDFWRAQSQVSGKPVDQIMASFVNQAGEPIIGLKAQCSGNTTSVTLSQRRYYSDRLKFEAADDQIWHIPLCLKGTGSAAATTCEVLNKKKATFTLPGCSAWVLGNANASGYYRIGYESDAVRALAKDAESNLSPAQRIVLESDIWASVRVGREPVGDYLALAEGLQMDHDRAVLENLLGRLDYIGQYLVDETDGDNFRSWLRQYLTPIAREVGWKPKPGEGDERKTLRAQLLIALGSDARDPEVQAEARKIADQALRDPASLDREFANAALALAASHGDQSFYDQVMAAIKNAKSPEVYYMYFSTLARFGDPKLLQRTLEYAVSASVRSQDAMQLITGVLKNPAGEKLAWRFIGEQWEVVQKAGGPFATVQIMGAVSRFCDAQMRDQVVDFFATHKVDGGERTYRQSIERINNCVDLKTQQQPQLASWLGEHGAAGGQ